MKIKLQLCYYSSTTSESTQATEEAIEDIERDMSVTALDESTSQLGGKLSEGNEVTSKEVEDAARREMLNGMRETLMTAAQEENLKSLCKICLGDQNRNKEGVPEVLIRCSQCTSLSKCSHFLIRFGYTACRKNLLKSVMHK